MKLKDVLRKDTILVDWNPVFKEDAIDLLVDALDNAGLLQDKDKVLADVKEREKTLSTGLEEGIAYPHARTNGVNQVAIAFGIVKEGLSFNSRDNKPAKFIPLLVSPQSGGAPHIYYMAEIVKLLERQKIREQLLQSNSAEQVYQILAAD